MHNEILENLTRQHQALKLLKALQEEEFTHLCEFRPQSVGALEFSIQELMRQLMSERKSLKRILGRMNPEAKRLVDMRETLADIWDQVSQRLQAIDKLEQFCAKQAEKSYSMALALFDQCNGYLDFFKKELAPKQKTYGRKGVYVTSKPAPAMMRGAL